ncbi:MAG TPA: hypothetical protein VLA34_01525 [Candidatus Krumholzibacterium sp.]|nr:hypothetical protein [Candidatus Krumholzibacterium sp.]
MILADLYGPVYRNVIFPLYDSVLRRRSTWKYYREISSAPYMQPEELERLRQERLSRLIEYCGSKVPFYRELFREKGIDPSSDIRDVRVLADRGVTVTKEDLRERLDDFISEDFRKEELVRNFSGGTTGVPVDLYKTFDHWCLRMAVKMRSEDWIGKKPGCPSTIIWGHKSGLDMKGWMKLHLYWGFQNYRFLSAMDLTEDRLLEYVKRIRRAGSRYVESYVNPVHLMALAIERAGVRAPRLDGIVTGAEKLLDVQKEKIESVFGCPVYDRYGCSELTNISCECTEHRGQHINADTLWVEVVGKGDVPVTGEPGEVVVTDLMGYAMPLIRYRTDDSAVLSDRRCDCGRVFPMFEEVIGKQLRRIKAPDGFEMTGKYFQWTLYDIHGIFRYQFVEKADDWIEIRIIPDGTVEHDTITARLMEGLSEFRSHGVRMTVEFVDEIPLTRSGKMNFFISERE